nr:multicilin [Nothobranchius furzeri]
MEMQRDRDAFGANLMIQGRRRETGEIPVPRSSSPVSVYVDFPCIVDQAFSTVAWGDLGSEVRQERDSLGSQVNESDLDDQHFADYALDFIADSSSTESSPSPVELVPFQGCIIPPLTPQRDFTPEDGMVFLSTETGNLSAQDGALWRGTAESHQKELGHSVIINKQLHETLQKQRHELHSLEEKNHHLRQLACRAKHLASVLEKLMTARDPHAGKPLGPHGENASLGSCKRQRLDEGYETESSDSVEDMLRDISTRCNAFLLSSAAGASLQQESETIRMHGAFSTLQMSTPNDSSETADQAGDSVPPFRTSVREHATIQTQVFPHGHAFTSRTRQGGYRFCWIPAEIRDRQQESFI